MMRILFSLLVIAVTTFVIVRNYFLPFYNRAAPPASEKIFIPTVKNAEVDSPDGTMKITLQTKNQEDKSIFYSIFTETESGQNKKLLYATSSAQGVLALSPNSWSPDNAYVFILQKVNNIVNGLVFKVDDKSTQNNQPYIVSKDNLSNITGWDSPTLLHVKTEEGTKKVTYWFDVESKIFMQLGG